jgi:outer membrane protein assembly factor BamB
MLPLAADDPRTIGEFRLHARLGSGGMGRVYLGHSPGGRAVAVKVIHPHLARDAEFVGRFRREVAAAQAVNGSYAAPVVAAGPDDYPPWLATAFVAGPPLADVVQAAGPLPEDAVLKLAAGLAEALRVIHACGLVHRDLKPANVLLAEDGPRVIDFGIARALEGTALTSAESLLGTPSYMSPEQAQGQPAGPASDVFSLGGVVYFAATGENPFGTGHPAVMLYRIVHTEPDLDRLPPRVRGLAAACLAKDPARRPTPEQLATALRGAVPPPDAPAAFWPAPVARLIRDGLAGPGPSRAGSTPPNIVRAPALEGAPAVEGAPTMARAPAAPPAAPGGTAGATRVDPRRPAGHRRKPEPVPGLGRRRALAALAGMATGGAAVAAWELTRPGPRAPSTAGQLAARHHIGAASGTGVWKAQTSSSVEWVAAADGIVYAGTNQDTVYALDADTGRQVWWRATATAENTQLVVAQGAVIIADPDNGGILALNAAAGRQLWGIKSTGGGVLGLDAAGPAVYAGYTAASDTTGGVTALSAATGQVLWTAEFAQDVDTNSGLTTATGAVYATTSDGEIYAFRAASGTRLWRVAGQKVMFGGGSPLASGGVVYACSSNNPPVVYAVRAATGSGLWQRSLGASAFPATLAAANGLLFAGLTRSQSAGPDAGDLSAWQAATGQRLWQIPVAGGVFPVLPGDGNVVYSGSNNGVLDAWQASTGHRLWSYAAADAIASNIALADGLVYFGSNDHHVYAVAA